MATAIVVQNNALDETVMSVVAAVQKFGISDVIAIGNPSLKGGEGINSYISLATISLGSAMRQAALIAKSHSLIFIDARVMPTFDGVRAMFEEGRDMMFAMLGESENIPEFSTEDIIETIAHHTSWPMSIVVTTKSTLRGMPDLIGETSTDILAQMAQIAAQRGVALTAFGQNVKEMGDEGLISLRTQARMLQMALGTYTLEQLFPELEDGSQSVSDTYNMLSALFIRFGDTTSALECLDGADTSNPRVLALKGMIAHARGETLGAVANMVSSLQQYEATKDMMRIPSQNLDSINGQLRAGLEALNKRQNDQALAYFADAVFQVDDFYKRVGIRQSEAD